MVQLLVSYSSHFYSITYTTLLCWLPSLLFLLLVSYELSVNHKIQLLCDALWILCACNAEWKPCKTLTVTDSHIRKGWQSKENDISYYTAAIYQCIYSCCISPVNLVHYVNKMHRACTSILTCAKLQLLHGWLLIILQQWIVLALIWANSNKASVCKNGLKQNGKIQ